MTINMNDEHLDSVVDLALFTKRANKVKFENVGSIVEKYIWVETILTRFRYFSVDRKAKSEVRKYISMVTEYSPSQLSRLIYKKKKTGKEKKKYDVYMTAYERLKSLPNAEQYLKEGIAFEILDKIAYEFSDNEWAEKMQKAKQKLFASFRR